MKKIVIAFDVTDELDELSAKRAMNADNAYIAINRIVQLLRQYNKYGMTHYIESPSEDSIQEVIISRLNDEILSIVTEEDINLDDLL